MTILADRLTAAVAHGDGPAVDAAIDDLWADAREPQSASRELVARQVRMEIDELPLSLLHDLLLMPGHRQHQSMARRIQACRHPSSVLVVKQVLDGGFKQFAYTCSEDVVIAKWFGHILADIGTPEAVTLIQAYAGSENAGISSEMQYRLRRTDEQAGK